MYLTYKYVIVYGTWIVYLPMIRERESNNLSVKKIIVKQTYLLVYVQYIYDDILQWNLPIR